MRWITGIVSVLLAALIAGFAVADTVSGPEPGKKLAPLRVFAATGEQQGKELDYVSERAAKLTVYVLVREWDRPAARFLKALDGAVQAESAQAIVVAAWLTDDKEATKRYLPLAQQSLKFQVTPLCAFLGDRAGPNEWDISPDARLTVVIARDGVSRARFGFGSVNEQDVPPVREGLKKALQP